MRLQFTTWITRLAAAGTSTVLPTANANAAIVEYTNLATFKAAVGAHSSLTFEGLADATVLGYR